MNSEISTSNIVSPAPDRPGAAHHPRVSLRPGGQKRVRAGHPWIFSNEIDMTSETRALPAGGLVTLVDAGGATLGSATFNPHPLVSARLLTGRADAAIDREFFARRLTHAAALRDALFDAPYYRLVWSEADRLPGLVIDRFGDVVVVQANTAGMDRLLPEIIAALDQVVAPECVVLRNNNAGRALEDLPQETIVARGDLGGAPIEVVENGVKFLADPADGQKTGWFYDHRENRARVARLARGRSVLDTYSYLGGFGIQAAVAGAARVVCVDRSEAALDLARRAAGLNGVADRCAFARVECFAYLAQAAASGETFDVVIADPPAFVKSKKDLRNGLKGYRKLARLAARCVAPGGFLLLASCSHHVDGAGFAEQLRGGLRDAHRTGRILGAIAAGPDHPVHPYLPESAYLKGALLQLD
jgi:23S rRNA (cytosine1962-C5)-methyltransferase